ncbi:MAG: MFS transporter [Microthrixaceae bacterium]
MTVDGFPERALTVDSPAIGALQRRTLRVVVASQVLGGLGLAAGVTVGALLAERMMHRAGVAGIPTALFTAGSALTAFVVGRLVARRGRRSGLGFGFVCGGAGALGVVTASRIDSVPLLLFSLFVYGAGAATNLQTRYAGTDLASPERRATAVSVAMVSTTLGAVAGPNLVGPLGHIAENFGLPDLAGPFMLAAVAYLAAGTVLFVALRPDPYLIALHLAGVDRPSSAEPAAPVASGAAVGGAVMIVTQMAMVAIMTMTPPHMRDHGHDLGDIGLVIGFHVAAMYLPSLVTGRLVDRVGRTPMVVAAGVVLLTAGVTAASVPPTSMPGLIGALMLLGLGWNLGLISGTALVVDATVPANRPRVQGTLDVLVALAGAGGGAMSGVVAAQSSYRTLALAGGALSIVLVPIVLRHRSPTPVPGDLDPGIGS